MLSAFATGSFLTGTAVLFTQIVGLTGAQVGLGMSVAGVVTLLGHVTITGAELWQSASDWGFQSELSDHRRLGDYQGVWGPGYQVGPIIFPGLYTFLALQWGAPGWAVIAALAVLAAVAHPAARAAERHLERVGASYVVPGRQPATS